MATDKIWKERIELVSKLGQCVGALQGLRHQVDEACRARIDKLLEDIGDPSVFGRGSLDAIRASFQNSPSPAGQEERKKTIRLAIKQLKACMCAGSDGRRLNLEIADQLRKIITGAAGQEEKEREQTLGKPGGELASAHVRQNARKRHSLKAWPEFFEKLADGSKTFEARQCDRDFQVGDELELHEFSPVNGFADKPTLLRRISYILRGPSFGIERGWCVMSLQAILSEHRGNSLAVGASSKDQPPAPASPPPSEEKQIQDLG